MDFLSSFVLLLLLSPMVVSGAGNSGGTGRRKKAKDGVIVHNKSTITKVIEGLLNRKDYDKHMRPGIDQGREQENTMVFVDIYVISLSSFNDKDMDFSVDMYLRQTWRDARLSYEQYHNKSITLNYDHFSMIWVPDLFFRNAKRGMFHTLTVPNRLLRIWPNGTILYSQRLSLVLGCDMHLEKFPMDNQTCDINIGSYGYTTDEVDFIWNPNKASPLNMKGDISLAEFLITGASAESCGKKKFSTGAFACLRAEFHLKRQFEYYFLQTFLPSALVVMLSWVSFWIDIEAVPARITLGLLTILTMTTQASSISERLPRVSYVKAIDVWMAMCLVMVFGALIEYSTVNVLFRRDKEAKKKQQKILAANRVPPRSPAGGGVKDKLLMDNDYPEHHHHHESGLHSRHSSKVTTPTGGLPQPQDFSIWQRRDPMADVIWQRRILPSARVRVVNNNHNCNTPKEGPASPTLQRVPSYHVYGSRAQSPSGDIDHEEEQEKTGCCSQGRALCVDTVSRVAFPMSFIAFNFVYWTYYLTS